MPPDQGQVSGEHQTDSLGFSLTLESRIITQPFFQHLHPHHLAIGLHCILDKGIREPPVLRLSRTQQCFIVRSFIFDFAAEPCAQLNKAGMQCVGHFGAYLRPKFNAATQDRTRAWPL